MSLIGLGLKLAKFIKPSDPAITHETIKLVAILPSVEERMIKDKILNQQSGDSAENYQAETINQYNVGLTYSEAKEIALDVFRSNALKFAEEAKEVARERVEELMEDFLNRLSDQDPELIDSVKDPGMQFTLYSAQKSYAISGDEDVAALLVEMLVKRAGESGHSLKRIVLDESIKVAPKLTQEQLSILTVVFLIAHSRQGGIRTWESLKQFLDTQLKPFVDSLELGGSSFQHLDYCGCGALSPSSVNLEDCFRTHYPHLFKRGFSVEDFEKRFGDPAKYADLLTTSIHNKTKLQENVSEEKVERSSHAHVTTNPDELATYLIYNGMSDAEIKTLIVNKTEVGGRLFEIWNEHLRAFRLTSVGLAIGKANVERKTGSSADLGIWIK